METCKKYDELPQSDKEQILQLIKKMKGKSWICDVIIKESDLKSYTFFVSVLKYNTVKGWATNGYIRQDKLPDNIWRLSYKPKVVKGEQDNAGRIKAYY
ncbi:hypothetical protein HQ865_01305 [Mucilaginibacter mali]|uniref:Uncharacterized protein n=1 Tax=Mucilaginibacter mali TaxID=2740462 RepID=A0A7D4QCW8_9SPHI|nr:hypothetical protein [Mucilaginibacter mali]QKJ28452.1 hypothetical protein HQ865_01305 [Mucilaginibacter mali]